MIITKRMNIFHRMIIFTPDLKGYQYMTDQLYKVMMAHRTTWLNSETTKR